MEYVFSIPAFKPFGYFHLKAYRLSIVIEYLENFRGIYLDLSKNGIFVNQINPYKMENIEENQEFINYLYQYYVVDQQCF